MRFFRFALFWMLLAAGAGASAEPRLDRDYRLFDPPKPVSTGERIEVIEFFYYGCPYCFDLQPGLNAWLKRQPPDVALRRIPVYQDSWLPLIKLYYTLEAMGEVERLHGTVYEAVHIRNDDLRNEITMLDWAVLNGLDRRKFSETYDSGAVAEKVKQSRQMTRDYGITGTPRLVIDGRYLTSSAMTGSHLAQIPVLEELVAMARRERAAKK
ncbi:MAG: thiol:disulfide interchange protein DsbA/DsbL [Betaproteobacteria bacterium]|nr:thiol:disulfide interchange protein DsbA/DsbL [Betaproteobacteria bacterium]